MSDATGILPAFFAYISQATAVTALMGAGYAARISPPPVPQEVPFAVGKPHLVYQMIDDRDVRILKGSVRNLHAATLQVDVWAKDAQERENLAFQVRLAMRRWNGTWGGVEIRSVAKLFEQGTAEDAQDASETPDWRQAFRFTVWHRNLQEV